MLFYHIFFIRTSLLGYLINGVVFTNMVLGTQWKFLDTVDECTLNRYPMSSSNKFSQIFMNNLSNIAAFVNRGLSGKSEAINLYNALNVHHSVNTIESVIG